MTDDLFMIQLSGDIPVIVESKNGPKTFWLNNDGVCVIEKLGPDKFIEKASATALKFLVD